MKGSIAYLFRNCVAYDASNRPIRFTKADGSVIVENGYDYMGRRYMQKITVHGTVTRHERYLYRGYLQIAALDILHGGAQMHALFWDPTEPLATRPLVLLASDDNRYTYAHDLTKNVTELLDAAGNIAATYDYEPFGKVTATGPAAHLNPVQWSSEIYDPELGLVYYNYRHYNPADGRWINRDPIAEQGGMNLYGFVENNTNIYFDQLDFEYKEIVLDKIYTYQEIMSIARGCLAYTGAVTTEPRTGAIAQPEMDPNSRDDIQEFKQSGKCCAKVMSARKVNLFVLTLLPKNSLNEIDSLSGIKATESHEGRRRKVYRLAYNRYLEVVQGDKPFVTKCGMICRKETGQAKRELSAYLDLLRKNAFFAYDQWIDAQQLKLDGEIAETDPKTHLMIGYTNIVHQFGSYDKIPMPKCPKKN